MTSVDLKNKQLKFIEKMKSESMTFLLILLSRNFDNMLMVYQNYTVAKIRLSVRF